MKKRPFQPRSIKIITRIKTDTKNKKQKGKKSVWLEVIDIFYLPSRSDTKLRDVATCSQFASLIRDAFLLSVKISVSMMIAAFRLVVPPSMKNLIGETVVGSVLVSIARMGSPSSVFWFYLLGEFLIGASLAGFLGFLALVRSYLPKPPRDLTGNVVLVTGANSTLGRSIADEFARNGCKVIRVDGADTAEKSAKDVSSSRCRREPNGGYECDLWNVKAIGKLADTIDREIGEIDVLVTCAGHAGQDIFDTVNVTLMSHYWTVLAFLPSMLKRERAHVVGVSPVSNPEEAYAGSKAAIAGLMESLGQEFSGRSSRLNFITVASKANPRSEGHSERLIARDVVQAVSRDRCALSANWCTTLLDLLSHPIRAGITTATRWLDPRGCEYSH